MIPNNLNELSEIEVAQLLRPLLKFEKSVIRLRFGLGTKTHTLEETATVLGSTREVIRKAELKAMNELGWVKFLSQTDSPTSG